MSNDIQENKIIMQFMGWEETDSEVYLGYMMPPENIASYIQPCHPRDTKYHTSWDWLMPSWGKLSSRLLAMSAFDLIEEFKNAVVKNDINAAYDVIVKGINLINE